jgi:hypothetical protein
LTDLIDGVETGRMRCLRIEDEWRKRERGREREREREMRGKERGKAERLETTYIRPTCYCENFLR